MKTNKIEKQENIKKQHDRKHDITEKIVSNMKKAKHVINQKAGNSQEKKEQRRKRAKGR